MKRRIGDITTSLYHVQYVFHLIMETTYVAIASENYEYGVYMSCKSTVFLFM